MKNLMVRTLSGLVLVAVFVGAVLGSQWSFGALLLLILVGGQTEFYKLARETGLSPQRWMGLAVGVLLFALNFIVFRQFSRSVTDEAGGAVLSLFSAGADAFRPRKMSPSESVIRAMPALWVRRSARVSPSESSPAERRISKPPVVSL